MYAGLSMFTCCRALLVSGCTRLPMRITLHSYKVCANWSGPMSASNKSASGTSGTCHCCRTGTATRVAGTDDNLTRPDSENNSKPSGQVHGPCDQPELKK